MLNEMIRKKEKKKWGASKRAINEDMAILAQRNICDEALVGRICEDLSLMVRISEK